jgi:hypothetical protein
MKCEIHFNDSENIKEYLDKIVSIAEDNVMLSKPDGSQSFGFFINQGYISFEGEWGIQRGDSDDLSELSKSYPNDEFALIRQFNRDVNTKVEDLTGYASKITLKNGVLTGTYKPTNITWEMAV